MRPSEFLPWEGELLLGYPTGPDGPITPTGSTEPSSPADLHGWDGAWIDLGGEG